MHLLMDYGGTKFRYVLTDKLDGPVDSAAVTTLPSKEIELRNFLSQQLQNHPLRSIRLSFAGQVSGGVIQSAPNIGLQAFDVRGFVHSLDAGVEVYMDNDINCAALAESAARPGAVTAVFYLGTGFGAALVHRGTLIGGAHNMAAEIGHIPYKPTPFTCSCGRNDCLELSCSGRAIRRWCNRFDIKLEYYTLQELKALSHPEAGRIVENFTGGFCHGFHTALNLFDPDRLVLGGGIGLNEPDLLDLLHESAGQSSFSSTREVTIERSQLQEGSLEGTRLL